MTGRTGRHTTRTTDRSWIGDGRPGAAGSPQRSAGPRSWGRLGSARRLRQLSSTSASRNHIIATIPTSLSGIERAGAIWSPRPQRNLTRNAVPEVSKGQGDRAMMGNLGGWKHDALDRLAMGPTSEASMPSGSSLPCLSTWTSFSERSPPAPDRPGARGSRGTIGRRAKTLPGRGSSSHGAEFRDKASFSQIHCPTSLPEKATRNHAKESETTRHPRRDTSGGKWDRGSWSTGLPRSF